MTKQEFVAVMREYAYHIPETENFNQAMMSILAEMAERIAKKENKCES